MISLKPVSSVVEATDMLELCDAELDRITAATLRVGDANMGPITITSEISPAGTDTLHLTSGGSVTQAASLSVGNSHWGIRGIPLRSAIIFKKNALS